MAPEEALPEQIYKIAEESEGGAARVLDQVEIGMQNFEEIQNLGGELMAYLALQEKSDQLDYILEKVGNMVSYAENGRENLDGIMDLYQYQDVLRQKMERIGNQLLKISDFIRTNLLSDPPPKRASPAPMHSAARKAPPEGDSALAQVEAIVKNFYKNS